jgi:hypothetical protein
MGRKPIGKTAMTATERQQRRRARLQALRPYAELERAWAACSREELSRVSAFTAGRLAAGEEGAAGGARAGDGGEDPCHVAEGRGQALS